MKKRTSIVLAVIVTLICSSVSVSACRYEDNVDTYAYCNEDLYSSEQYDDHTEYYLTYDDNDDQTEYYLTYDDNYDYCYENDYGFAYSDLYQDEYQAAWYSPVQLNTCADFYSYQGEYICTIPAGETVFPDESIGNSFDILYVNYNGQNGYIFTNTVVDDEESTTGSIRLLKKTTNLRNEYGNILTTIPEGFGVEIISYDEDTDRYYVIYNGWGGTIPASAFYSYDQTVSEDYSSEVNYSNESWCEPCKTGNYATIKSLIGANLRDKNCKIIVAIPYGESVEILDTDSPCGRTMVRWGKYAGSVLTSCLQFK